MPGICGLVSVQPVADLSALLAQMMRRMMHAPWFLKQGHTNADGTLALGRVSLGFADRSVQPASNEDGTLLAVMEGEVYDYARQRRTLEAAGRRFTGTSHAELLLLGFESKGEAFFRGLNGSFAAALWDARQHRVMLVNDRFGMKPLYYAALPDKLVFASEIKSLLVHPEIARTINPRGLAQFFTFGQFLGEDTLLETVRILPGAALGTYDVRSGRMSCQKYWRPGAAPTQGPCADAEHLERIDMAFKRAVDARTHGTKNLGLSLSGGLDARTILGVMDADCAATSITMGVDGSIDLRAAAEMARLTQRRNVPYILNTDFLAGFEEHLRRMVHLTDGQYLSQCIVMPTLSVYREHGIEVLLRGHAGELMHMDKAYNFSLDPAALALKDTAALEQWLFRRLACHMSQELQGRLFAAPYQAEIDGLARQSLRECLAESEDVAPTVHRIWHLFLSQRLRRETSLSMVKFGSVVDTRLPYLDNEVVDALLAAPPQLKIGDRIQRYILERRRPEFVNVVNANTGARLGAGWLARKLAKLRLKVLAKLGVRGYQPYERLGRWLREDLSPLVRKLLLSSRFLERGCFNPTTVRSIIDGHLQRGQNHTFLLMAMMIFEVGQQQLIDGDGASQGSPQPAICAEAPVPA